MPSRPARMPVSVVLAIGVLLGWTLANFRPAPARASAGDRSGDSIVATGPVLVRYDEGTKSPIALDALYFLDFKGGRLLATIPTYRQFGASTRLIESFEERDLVADFKLDLDTGPRPHFLMTTGALGSYSAGWAPLYVFETSTSQVGVYRVSAQQGLAGPSQGRFELVELRSYAKAAPAEPAK
jgi:hypothetical protein